MGKNGLLLSHERADSYCPHPLKGLDKIATVSGVDPFSTLVDAEKNMWKGFEVLFVEAVAEKIGFDIRFVRQVPVDMVVKANCRIFFFDNREYSYSPQTRWQMGVRSLLVRGSIRAICCRELISQSQCLITAICSGQGLHRYFPSPEQPLCYRFQ